MIQMSVLWTMSCLSMVKCLLYLHYYEWWDNNNLTLPCWYDVRMEYLSGEEVVLALGSEVDRLEKEIQRLVPGIRHVDIETHNPNGPLWCFLLKLILGLHHSLVNEMSWLIIAYVDFYNISVPNFGRMLVNIISLCSVKFWDQQWFLDPAALAKKYHLSLLAHSPSLKNYHF